MSFSISSMRNFAYPVGYTGPARSKENGETKLDKAIEDLKALASKTPAEKARDAVLKSHGLDEKSYSSLSTDARNLIEQQIAEAVQRATNSDGTKETTRFA